LLIAHGSSLDQDEALRVASFSCVLIFMVRLITQDNALFRMVGMCSRV
jgi:hypothetical protein